MSAFDTVQRTLDRYLAPVAEKLMNNRGIQAIAGGTTATMPVILGVAFIAIIINLPIAPLSEFLAASGLGSIGNQVLSVTMSMLAIYMVFSIGSRFGESLGLKGNICAVFCTGVFLVLMPLQNVTDAEGVTGTFISPSYLGSNGIFVAILIGLVVPWALSKLMKVVEFKLPDSVPSMVSDALSPTFAAIIMFTVAGLIKWAFTFTPWGNFFDMFGEVVGAPITSIGSQPFAPIIVQTVAMTFWFFGIHPNAIVKIYDPVVLACSTANLEAFLAGDPLPYLSWQIVNLMVGWGYCADGLPTALSLFLCKSERYKAMARLAIVPAIFNITEPMMFGLPIVMNPVFFLPFVLIKPIIGALTMMLMQFGLVTSLNPAVSTTWIMPNFITAFLTGGGGMLLMCVIGFVVSFLVFLPFVKTADRLALKEEEANCEPVLD